LTLVVATAGAIASIIFTITELYVRVYLPKKQTERLSEKKALESLKTEYERCAWSIENNIEKCVEKNELTNFKANLSQSWVVGKAEISEELKRQVQEYNEKLELYDVLCRASRNQIKSIIGKKVRDKFPKTLKKPVQLDNMLQHDYLLTRYFNGEKVTDNWLKEEHSKQRKQIIEALDETEIDEFDSLLQELNNELGNDVILQGYRKEKKGLMEHGKKATKNLKIEISSLNEKLKKYSNLRYEKPEQNTKEVRLEPKYTLP